MPGRASLTAGRYYAHPQNAFWRIVCDALQIDPRDSYEERVAALIAARIAVWDVLRSCVREGSLDADIGRHSEIANDLPGFLLAHPAIRIVAFNGATAETCFRRHVLARLPEPRPQFVRLPSTSPAHAALAYSAKLAAWRAILDRR